MFCVTILGSGSAGNCALVETAQTRLLIDGGLSAKQMIERLEKCGVDPLAIDAILLTHEHGDHTGGIDVWCKRFPTPIYCNRLTKAAQESGAPGLRKDWRLFVTRSDITIKDINIETFDVPHDAEDPVGFVLHHGGAEFGFLTDLGFPAKHIHERIRHVKTLVIEANYDEKLLENDKKRPRSVKQRITQRHGHLSNTLAAGVIAELLGKNLRRAVLGHLSRDCNSPELAAGAVRERVGDAALDIFCAMQHEVSPRFLIG